MIGSLNVVLLLIWGSACHLRERIRGKDGVHQCDAAGILRTFEMLFPNFGSMTDSQSWTCFCLYSGGQRGTEHSV